MDKFLGIFHLGQRTKAQVKANEISEETLQG